MSKRYVLEVEVDEHGECFVTLPDQLLEDAQWDVGDVLEYSEDIDGSIIITKFVS
jgi:bifunctional DNA-binding transcriptional regulator/antitoxin component of YhaV-PrlF toxin-antitoxin module